MAGHAGYRLSVLCAVALFGCDQFARVGVVDVLGDAETDAGDGDGDAAAAGDGGRPTVGPAPGDAGTRCEYPPIAVCDPIANVGCPPELSMQCAVDLAALVPAGYCTFSAPIIDAGLGCLNTLVTESCPPRSTCYGGMCRDLCICDSDCEPGECCTDPVGTQGFKVCGACTASEGTQAPASDTPP